MAAKDRDDKKCFTFQWHIKNCDYLWQKQKEWIESPTFVVDAIEGTKWKLCLFPRGGSQTENTYLFLVRHADRTGPDCVEIEYKLSFLEMFDEVLVSSNLTKEKFPKDHHSVVCQSVQFKESNYGFLPHWIICQCQIWKSEGEMSENILCLVRSKIVVDRMATKWKIGDYNLLEPEKKLEHEIKSLRSGNSLISLELSGCGVHSQEIRLNATQMDQNIKAFSLRLFLKDRSGKMDKCFGELFLFDVPGQAKKAENCFDISKITGHGSFDEFYLKCGFCYGMVVEEYTITNPSNIELNFDSECLDSSSDSNSSLCSSIMSDDELPDLKKDLSADLKTLLNRSFHYHCHSDIGLKTSRTTYPAHKCILSARSSEFESMISAGINISSIDIENDLKGDIVFRMLRYIYCGEVEDLNWDRATGLYKAAVRYKLHPLKNVCLSHIKKNVSRSNASEALQLADLHQDEDLKNFMKDFISKCDDDSLVAQFSKLHSSEENEQQKDSNSECRPSSSSAPPTSQESQGWEVYKAEVMKYIGKNSGFDSEIYKLVGALTEDEFETDAWKTLFEVAQKDPSNSNSTDEDNAAAAARSSKENEQQKDPDSELLGWEVYKARVMKYLHDNPDEDSDFILMIESAAGDSINPEQWKKLWDIIENGGK